MKHNHRNYELRLGRKESKPDTSDHSLRGAAFERAREDHPPRTATPWEWEDWYRAHPAQPPILREQHRSLPTHRSFIGRILGRGSDHPR